MQSNLCKNITLLQTGEQLVGKSCGSAPGFLCWGPIEGMGRRPKYTLCYSVGSLVTVASVEYDVSIMRYAMSPSQCSLPASGFVREYTSGVVVEDGGFLLAGTTSGEFAVFRMDAKVYRCAVPVGANGVVNIVLMQDASLLFGCGDGAVRRFEGRDMEWACTGECMLTGSVMSLSAQASHKTAIAATAGGRVFQVECGDSLAAVSQEVSHVAAVTCVCFGRRRSDVVCTGSADGTVRVWDLSDYGVLQVSAASGVVRSVWLDDEVDGSVISGWDDGCIRCFEGGTGAAMWKIQAHRSKVNAVAGTEVSS